MTAPNPVQRATRVSDELDSLVDAVLDARVRFTAELDSSYATIQALEAEIAELKARGRDLDQANARADKAEKLVAYLMLQSQSWAIEARGQRSTVQEAYQAVTGATGELGDWNGARPIIEAVDKLKDRATAAETALAEARSIVRDTLWMARRYADGRRSYAVGMYNDAARKALVAGIVKDDQKEPLFAHDGMGSAECAELSQEEQAVAARYAGSLAEAREAIRLLRNGPKQASGEVAAYWREWASRALADAKEAR